MKSFGNILLEKLLFWDFVKCLEISLKFLCTNDNFKFFLENGIVRKIIYTYFYIKKVQNYSDIKEKGLCLYFYLFKNVYLCL